MNSQKLKQQSQGLHGSEHVAVFQFSFSVVLLHMRMSWSLTTLSTLGSFSFCWLSLSNCNVIVSVLSYNTLFFVVLLFRIGKLNLNSLSLFIFTVLCLVMLGIKPRISCRQGKHDTK